MLHFTTLLRTVSIALLIASYVLGDSQSIDIISWNIQDFGKSKDDQEILFIAKIIKDAEIVAIQEVVAKDPGGAQAVARLADQLNRMGSKWDYRISEPTESPSANISERYAYLWKTSSVEMIHRPYLDSALSTYCDREPFIGRFRIVSNKREFILVNFHSRRFDNSPEEEVKHFSTYPKRFNIPVIIAGDFNMPETHIVFNTLYCQGYYPTLKNKKTTLKQKCDNTTYLNHAIDNIYLPNSFTLIKGHTIDFIKECESLEPGRMISDHLPVQCTISIIP